MSIFAYKQFLQKMQSILLPKMPQFSCNFRTYGHTELQIWADKQGEVGA